MLKSIFTDLYTIQLTFVGISFSIFTILFSLIIGKKGELRIISKNIKSGNFSPESRQTEKWCLNSIKNMRSMCNWAILIGLVSACLSLISWLAKIFEFSHSLLIIILCICCLEVIGIILITFKIIFLYLKQSKV